MRSVISLAAICSFLMSGCSPKHRQLTREEAHDWARNVSEKQLGILRAIPALKSESAEMPTTVDMWTGANISATYWAPNFVLGIITPPDHPAIGVLSQIQFPPHSHGWVDPHTLPVKVYWTSENKCDALERMVKQLKSAAARAQAGLFRSTWPSGDEFDGGGYTVSIMPLVRNADFSTTIISGNDFSAIGKWVQSARVQTRECWQPFS